jgi:hypothetical protein
VPKDHEENLVPSEKSASRAWGRDPATGKEGQLVAPPRRKTAWKTSSSPAEAKALHGFRRCPTQNPEPATTMRPWRGSRADTADNTTTGIVSPRERGDPDPGSPTSNSTPTRAAHRQPTTAAGARTAPSMPPRTSPRRPRQSTAPHQAHGEAAARDRCYLSHHHIAHARPQQAVGRHQRTRPP